MSAKTTRKLLLAKRPSGEVKDSDFELVTQPLREPGEGEILVENLQLSIDPTNRIWMTDAPQYMPPVNIGEVMRGLGVGVVVASKCEGFAVGDAVAGMVGWQEHACGRPDEIGVQRVERIPGVPLSAYFGVLGATGGMTAYFGLLDVGRPKAGETVLVSAAAGSVGSLVGQIAKIHGCRVIGVAGGPEKCAYVTDELGFDGCIDYKKGGLEEAVKAACPDGIDVYFDNVGGAVLDAVLTNLSLRARIVICGLISAYNEDSVPGPKNFEQVLMRRARVEGFIILDYGHRFPEAAAKLIEWWQAGKLRYRETVLEGGLEMAPEALRRLLRGEKKGKLSLRISESAS